MFVFATSDKGGTGRSVTSSNILYRAALQGLDVCYLDFDFGSPTAGAIFGVTEVERGTDKGSGLHAYLQGRAALPYRVDVWKDSRALRGRPAGAGQLVLMPGDQGGGEFTTTAEVIKRCVDLFVRVNEEFTICLVDLSAGRSTATEVVLAATGQPALRSIDTRWLVFHRWTRQHVLAASGLVQGLNGLTEVAKRHGHDQKSFIDNLRYVRTATIDPSLRQNLDGLTTAQVAWLRQRNRDLATLASKQGVGRGVRLGTVPLDPVLQWQEQLISDEDVAHRVANRETLEAFEDLAKRIADESAWENL